MDVFELYDLSIDKIDHGFLKITRDLRDLKDNF
jgi:hypothetical protein